jgi:hypothetical protein
VASVLPPVLLHADTLYAGYQHVQDDIYWTVLGHVDRAGRAVEDALGQVRA